MTNFKVVSKISKRIDFTSRSWNSEKIDRYLLQYDEKRIIECMTIIHLKDNKPVDITVELSNMYNCIVGCRFCASGSLPEHAFFLTAEDYMKQVETCLQASNENPDDFLNFYIAFTGIGEPSLVKENIAKGIEIIRAKYNNVKVVIATTGFDNTCFEYWANMNLPIRTLQLPYYAGDIKMLKYIIKNLPDNYDLLDNIRKAIKYKNNHEICRVKINFVVMENINSSNEEINKMLNVLSEFKRDIIIKVSYLNYTKKCEENNLYSPNETRMLEILELIKSKGFDCYLFGTKANTELGCGQLVQNYISQDVKHENAQNIC